VDTYPIRVGFHFRVCGLHRILSVLNVILDKLEVNMTNITNPKD